MLCVELKSKYDLWYFWAVTTAASTQRRIWRAPSSSTTFQPWIAHLCEISHIFSKLPTLPTLLYGLKLFDKKFVNIVIISTLPRWSRSHRRPSPPKSCRCPCLTPARAPPPAARKILSRKSVTKITKINLKPLKKKIKKYSKKCIRLSRKQLTIITTAFKEKLHELKSWYSYIHIWLNIWLN